MQTFPHVTERAKRIDFACVYVVKKKATSLSEILIPAAARHGQYMAMLRKHTDAFLQVAEISQDFLYAVSSSSDEKKAIEDAKDSASGGVKPVDAAAIQETSGGSTTPVVKEPAATDSNPTSTPIAEPTAGSATSGAVKHSVPAGLTPPRHFPKLTPFNCSDDMWRNQEREKARFEEARSRAQSVPPPSSALDEK